MALKHLLDSDHSQQDVDQTNLSHTALLYITSTCLVCLLEVCV